jgi:hypothetical protein
MAIRLQQKINTNKKPHKLVMGFLCFLSALTYLSLVKIKLG